MDRDLRRFAIKKWCREITGKILHEYENPPVRAPGEETRGIGNINVGNTMSLLKTAATTHAPAMATFSCPIDASVVWNAAGHPLITIMMTTMFPALESISEYDDRDVEKFFDASACLNPTAETMTVVCNAKHLSPILMLPRDQNASSDRGSYVRLSDDGMVEFVMEYIGFPHVLLLNMLLRRLGVHRKYRVCVMSTPWKPAWRRDSEPGHVIGPIAAAFPAGKKCKKLPPRIGNVFFLEESAQSQFALAGDVGERIWSMSERPELDGVQFGFALERDEHGDSCVFSMIFDLRQSSVVAPPVRRSWTRGTMPSVVRKAKDFEVNE